MMGRQIKKVDFVIGYELWKRELLGDTLLKLELQRRGYSVEMVNRCVDTEGDRKREILAPRVVIYPWIYSDTDVKRAMDFAGNVQHLVNLQSEQIFSTVTMKKRYAEGNAKHAFHVCWGDMTRKRFLENGVSEDHVRTCGNIHLDMNNKRFTSAFPDRDEMSRKYHLDTQKKWVVFLSNFRAAVVYPEKYKSKSTEEEREVGRIERQARTDILSVFTSYLEKNDRAILIYRSHPDEGAMPHEELDGLERRFPHFRVISERSIQDWVRVSDAFITYISTGIADAYYAGKPCALIRPVERPEQYDNDLLMHHTKRITDAAELARFIEGEEPFPIATPEVIQNVISNLEDRSLAYVKLADWLEEIIKKRPTTDKIRITHENTYSLRHRIRRNIMFMRGSTSFRWVQKIVLKPLYHMSEEKDLHKLDFLPRLFHCRSFSEQNAVVRRQERTEERLRPLVEEMH